MADFIKLHLAFRYVTDYDYMIRNADGLFRPDHLNPEKAAASYRYVPSPDGDGGSITLDIQGDPAECRIAAIDFMDALACAVAAHKPYLIQALNDLIIHPCRLLQNTERDFRYGDALSDRGNYAGTEILLEVTYDG